jgi:hypothetical protein
VSPTRVVVDGSNIATEGRSTPSLRQLDDAVRQFQDEFPEAETIVVVDATFGHRIDKGERKAFDEAVVHGDMVSPPAGAIGRGDAFVLRIAERVGGQVLSNDSFQEFLQEHPWLFDEGRLIGGKPVPKVGWIFTPRRPVRGPRPRSAAEAGPQTARSNRKSERPEQRSAAAGAGASSKRRRRGRSAAVLDAVEAAAAEAVEAATASAGEGSLGLEEVLVASAKAGGTAKTAHGRSARPGASRRRRQRRRRGDPAIQAAIQAATEEAIGAPSDGAASPAAKGRKAATTTGPQAVNDPLTFLTFISEHPLGDEVTGVVSNFVSHGAMVDVGAMHCYAPLSGLGNPPPNSARAVLRKGETRPFVVVALDPPRRGAQLALPELAPVRGRGAPSRTLPGKAKEAKAKTARRGSAQTRSPSKTTKVTKAPTAKKTVRAGTSARASKAKAASTSQAARATKAKASNTAKAGNAVKGRTATKAARGKARG